MSKIPLYFLYGVEDERTQRLMKRVWQRIPAHDRHVLRELVLDVSDPGDSSDGTLGSTGGVDPNTLFDGCAAQVAEGLNLTVRLGGVKKAQSDAVGMYIIAHEFAHVVLRHSEMSVVVGLLHNLGYTDADQDTLKEWHEDEADLLAWLWGFKDELQAFLDAYPKARRPRWYVTLEQGPPVTNHRQGRKSKVKSQ
jgi:hypothetical protein